MTDLRFNADLEERLGFFACAQPAPVRMAGRPSEPLGRVTLKEMAAEFQDLRTTSVDRKGVRSSIERVIVSIVVLHRY